MRDPFVELAEKDGFEQGWRDAWADAPRHPQPDLGWGMFDLDYRRAYQDAYRDGYDTAEQERRLDRRQRLVEERATQQAEREDVDHNRDG